MSSSNNPARPLRQHVGRGGSMDSLTARMKFPAGSKKFPHLLRREFSLQLIELVGQLSAKNRTAGAGIGEIPCCFPAQQGNRGLETGSMSTASATRQSEVCGDFLKTRE
jgi:hypothetical protein